MIKSDPRNAERIAFLDALESWVSAQTSPESTSLILPWIIATRDSVVSSLRQPKPEDASVFVSLAHARGGVAFFATVYVSVRISICFQI